MIFNKSGKLITSNMFTFNNNLKIMFKNLNTLAYIIVKTSGIYTKGKSELSIYNQEKFNLFIFFHFYNSRSEMLTSVKPILLFFCLEQ